MRLLPPLTAPLALGLLSALATPQGSIHSHLLVEPGKQVVLSGYQLGAFRVRGRNAGPVPVEVCERLRTGQLLRRAVLAPGARASLAFVPGPRRQCTMRAGSKQCSPPASAATLVAGPASQLQLTKK